MPGISLKEYVWLCRSLGQMLDAGVPITRVLTSLGAESRRGELGRILSRVKSSVLNGAPLAEAFRTEGPFPSLFTQLVAVGEESGALGRVLKELARFYEFQQRLRRRFIQQITLPVIQYMAAVLIVSLAHYIVNLLVGVPSPLGRLWWSLLLGYGAPLAAIAAYFWMVKPLFGTRMCHKVILRVPVAGHVMRMMALARFSLTMFLMSEAGVLVSEALERSFEATDNGAFAAQAGTAGGALQNGSSLTEALTQTSLFPWEYLEVVRVAEESGKLLDQFDWLASHYIEKAENAMATLTTVIARLIWLMVVLFIVKCIFQMYAQYGRILSEAVRGA